MKKITSRSKWDIILEALSYSANSPGLAASRLITMIGVTYRDGKRYIAFLEKKGFIETVLEDGVTRCEITKSGSEIKEKIQGIYDLFGGTRPKW